MHFPPPAILNIFNKHNFSIMSNLFDNNKPYGEGLTELETMQTKCVIFGEGLTELGTKIQTKFALKLFKKY